jgi:DNA polymerase-1
MPKKLLLVDASNHAYRAYHAIQSDMRAPDGFPTRALYGFTRMLQGLMRDQKPDYVALVFDRGQSFRNALYPDYKGQRPDMPEDLRRQWPELVPLSEAYGFTFLNLENTEADDVIGTLAIQMASDEVHVKIVSGDKDFCQLVNDKIRILDLLKGQEYGPAEVELRWGVPPSKMIDLLSLMGDSSDNVPGIPGVGEKKAAQFLQKYGDMEGVLANHAAIGGKTGQAVADSVEKVRLARRLVTIVTDMPLGVTLEQLIPRPPDKVVLTERLTRYNFKGLLKELGVEAAPIITSFSNFAVHVPATVWGRQPLMALADVLARQPVAIAPHGTDSLQALEFAWAGGSAFVPWDDHAIEILQPALNTAGILAYDSKNMLRQLRRLGVSVGRIAGDPMLGDYLLGPDHKHELEDLAQRLLGYRPVGGRGEVSQLALAMVQAQEAEIQKQKLGPVLESIELPIVPILADMEEAGIYLNSAELQLLSQELEGRIQGMMAGIYQEAGESFNVNSTQQLAAILYDKLGLTPGKKTKFGRSTDAETLEKLEHPLAKAILAYRELAKLKSTYVDALPKAVGSDGRVHTTLQQAVAATGRLSSIDPNLQNIPIRSEEGRRIRHCFVAKPGHIFLSADYSQIELRVLAHFCDDGPLAEAFRQNQDIHRRTASEVFGVAQDLVTSEMRRAAKAINFGIVYGMSAFRLANDLNISRTQAQAYIDGYFERQPQVRTYMDLAIQQARDLGYATTLYGRRRPVAGITASNPMDRGAAERIAINTPIQGTSADLIKLAMVKVHHALWGTRAKLLLQVHDELLFELPEEDVPEVGRRVKEAMEGVAQLRVPLKVELGTGTTWDTAH